MRDTDLDTFSRSLDAVCNMLSRGNYTPNPTNTAMWFRSLAAYPLDVVLAGFDAHAKDPQRGRFTPTPADIIAQVQGRAADDGRPGAEEAWAIAVRGADESETIVWTDETARAWNVAYPIWRVGDEVGARMAFKESYGRLVGEARNAGKAPKWAESLGFDAQRRDAVIREAHEAGRLAGPAPVALITGPQAVEAALAAVPPDIREKFAKVLVAKKDAEASKAWAYRLKALDEEGAPLTDAQRLAYRAAVGDLAPVGVVIGEFRPVKFECLPPRMRADIEAGRLRMSVGVAEQVSA